MQTKSSFLKAARQTIELIEDNATPDWLAAAIVNVIHAKSRMTHIDVWTVKGEWEDLSAGRLARLFCFTKTERRNAK